jgi:Cu2+-exporting ATPase
VRLGRRAWAAPEAEPDTSHDGAELWLTAGDGSRHRLRFRNALRDDAAKTVTALEALGLHVLIVSGDRAESVKAVAGQAGIEDWRADCRPDDKVRALNELSRGGARVLMVGDGLNDAPALAAGFVSASPAAAADISRTAADVVYQGERLQPVLWLIRVARAAHRRVRENIALSIVYNALAVPLAMAGMVTPLIAALAMSTSSILVSLNALRLTRTRLSG